MMSIDENLKIQKVILSQIHEVGKEIDKILGNDPSYVWQHRRELDSYHQLHKDLESDLAVLQREAMDTISGRDFSEALAKYRR